MNEHHNDGLDDLFNPPLNIDNSDIWLASINTLPGAINEYYPNCPRLFPHTFDGVNCAACDKEQKEKCSNLKPKTRIAMFADKALKATRTAVRSVWRRLWKI